MLTTTGRDHDPTAHGNWSSAAVPLRTFPAGGPSVKVLAWRAYFVDTWALRPLLAPLPRQEAMANNQPMTPEQAAILKRLAQLAYELDAFKPNLTSAEADRRIAALNAKLKLLDEPPHTL